MRNLSLLIVFTSLIVSFSCNKPDRLTSTKSHDAERVKEWLQSEKSKAPIGRRTKIEALEMNLDLSELSSSRLNTSEFLVVIPIKNSLKLINNRDKECYSVLLATLDNAGSVKNGNIVQYISTDQSKPEISAENLSGIFNNKPKVNGTLRFLTISDRYLYELEYRNEKLYSHKKMKSSVNKASSVVETECIDWYIVTTLTYPDGTTYTIEEFIGTTCGSTGCLPVDPTVEIEDCEGSGSGGGGGEECCVPPNFQITSSSGFLNTTHECGLEGIDPVSGKPTKPCTLGWKFSTNTLLFYTWSYISREHAVMEKEAGLWQFKSLEHAGMDIQGTIPPCVSFSCNITSAQPSIAANKASAQMNLTYTTSLNVTCCPWCSPTNNSESAQAFWPASSF